MSSIFKSPKRPKVPVQDEAEAVSVIEEDAEQAKRRERKRIATGGRQQTILSGIASALKRRLGE